MRSEMWKELIGMNKWIVNRPFQQVGWGFYPNNMNYFSVYYAHTSARKANFEYMKYGWILFQMGRATLSKKILVYDVWTKVVAEGYVRSKTLHQYMRYGQMLSQRATCVAQKKRTFYWDRLSGISFSETKRIYINLYCVF